jgi:hypothetical protein
MITIFFPPFFYLNLLIGVLIDCGKNITRLDHFYIIFDKCEGFFIVGCNEYKNVPKVLGLSQYVTEVPI